MSLTVGIARNGLQWSVTVQDIARQGRTPAKAGVQGEDALTDPGFMRPQEHALFLPERNRPVAPYLLPSLSGRGRGWVGERSEPRYDAAIRRIPDFLTANARALRNGPTDAERLVWRRISRYRPRFTRQLVIGLYIVDLACRSAKLAVEFDGAQHLEAQNYDGRRTKFLTESGWSVLRFWNSEGADNPDGVVEAILLKTAECLGGTHPQPLPCREGRKKAERP
jgi:very-short-patch-repair endonuclease